MTTTKKEIEKNDFGLRHKCKSCRDWKNNCTSICLDCFNNIIRAGQKQLLDEFKKMIDEFNDKILKGEFTPEQLLFIQGLIEKLNTKIIGD